MYVDGVVEESIHNPEDAYKACGYVDQGCDCINWTVCLLPMLTWIFLILFLVDNFENSCLNKAPKTDTPARQL